ncbi:MAG: superoxide dismutase family protein [Rhizobacter sp.]
MKLGQGLSSVLLAALGAAGCASSSSPAGGPPSTPYVVASLQPTAGNTASGTVWLSQDGPDVRIRGVVSGLKPNREHGFHVHEKGDCSAPDATSAGGHLNPTAKPHGPQSGEHHAGDLPALKADASGKAEFTMRVKGTVLGSGATDLGGKALVVHADPDDYASQPAGNSGSRIACGVISSSAGRDASGKEVLIPKEL